MATQNPTLTEKSVKALKPKASVYRVRDGIADPALKGFGVVVAPSGTKSFFLAFTSPESAKRTQGTLGMPTSSVGMRRAAVPVTTTMSTARPDRMGCLSTLSILLRSAARHADEMACSRVISSRPSLTAPRPSSAPHRHR